MGRFTAFGKTSALVIGTLTLGAGGCGSNVLDPIQSAPTIADAGGVADTGTGGNGGHEPTPDGGTPTMPSNKRGVAYGYHSDADLAALVAGNQGIGWWYNWAAKPDDTLSKGTSGLGVDFVPMVWGAKFDVATLATQVPSSSKFLLTFNEPNFGAQANLTPDQAAALWPQIQAFADERGMKIVSPAVNYCGGSCNETDPFVWLEKFFAACTDCRVDYVAMHWYACSKGALTGTLAKYEKFGKPLWLTEFSCLDEPSKVNDADELAYMQDAVAALEANPMVFRYAWFSGRYDGHPEVSLLTKTSGELTPLGAKYVSMSR